MGPWNEWKASTTIWPIEVLYIMASHLGKTFGKETIWNIHWRGRCFELWEVFVPGLLTPKSRLAKVLASFESSYQHLVGMKASFLSYPISKVSQPFVLLEIEREGHNANHCCWCEQGTLHLDHSHELICEPRMGLLSTLWNPLCYLACTWSKGAFVVLLYLGCSQVLTNVHMFICMHVLTCVDHC